MRSHEVDQAGEGAFSLPLWLAPECCLADGVDGVASAASGREREREREHPHGRQVERTAVEVEGCCSAATAESALRVPSMVAAEEGVWWAASACACACAWIECSVCPPTTPARVPTAVTPGRSGAADADGESVPVASSISRPRGCAGGGRKAAVWRTEGGAGASGSAGDVPRCGETA